MLELKSLINEKKIKNLNNLKNKYIKYRNKYIIYSNKHSEG